MVEIVKKVQIVQLAIRDRQCKKVKIDEEKVKIAKTVEK